MQCSTLPVGRLTHARLTVGALRVPAAARANGRLAARVGHRAVLVAVTDRAQQAEGGDGDGRGRHAEDAVGEAVRAGAGGATDHVLGQQQVARGLRRLLAVRLRRQRRGGPAQRRLRHAVGLVAYVHGAMRAALALGGGTTDRCGAVGAAPHVIAVPHT